jgi:translation initiation factor IF-2
MVEKTLEKSKSGLVERPPIVAVLGHIDHGKTTLLDYIRKTAVTEKEAGGITQHIGAYETEYAGKKISFIDTPGHEAFEEIRSRGAKVADIAILIVAADEGIKPQTKEAVRHIKEANVPFVVAINKIDKPEANTQKIKQQLAEEDILIEEWGGKIPGQEISAKQGTGVAELLDTILLMAELEELKADPKTKGEGVVIESHQDAQKGVLVTLLIRNGVLEVGDFVVAEHTMGKIKAMEDFQGQKLKEASFSSPIQILGFSELPPVGALFKAFKTKGDAEKNLATPQEKTMETVPVDAENGEETKKRLSFNLILRADSQGSLDALNKVAGELQFEEVGINILDAQIGDIADADIRDASTTQAQIIGFNVKVIPAAKKLLITTPVKVHLSSVIYELIDQIKEEVENILPAEIKHIDLGQLKVLAIFKRTAAGQVIGGKVISGRVKRGATAEVIRDEVIVAQGQITQLQQNKTEAQEVKEGNECGILFSPASPTQAGPASPTQAGPIKKELAEAEPEDKTKSTIQAGDVLKIYEEKKIKRELHSLTKTNAGEPKN